MRGCCIKKKCQGLGMCFNQGSVCLACMAPRGQPQKHIKEGGGRGKTSHGGSCLSSQYLGSKWNQEDQQFKITLVTVITDSNTGLETLTQTSKQSNNKKKRCVISIFKNMQVLKHTKLMSEKKNKTKQNAYSVR